MSYLECASLTLMLSARARTITSADVIKLPIRSSGQKYPSGLFRSGPTEHLSGGSSVPAGSTRRINANIACSCSCDGVPKPAAPARCRLGAPTSGGFPETGTLSTNQCSEDKHKANIRVAQGQDNDSTKTEEPHEGFDLPVKGSDDRRDS